MTIKGILFDMDGVLLDTEKFHFQAWKSTFQMKGVQLTKSAYVKHCQAQGRQQAIKNILGHLTEEDITILSQEKGKAYLDSIDQNHIQLYPDAMKLMTFLAKHKDISLAIASSSVVADYVIKKTNAANQFESIITGEMISRNKPYPEIFELAARSLALQKQNLVIVEDSPAGVIAGRLAGINVFALNRDGSLSDFDSLHIEKHIKEAHIVMTETWYSNLFNSKTITIDSLDAIIPYLE